MPLCFDSDLPLYVDSDSPLVLTAAAASDVTHGSLFANKNIYFISQPKPKHVFFGQGGSTINPEALLNEQS